MFFNVYFVISFREYGCRIEINSVEFGKWIKFCKIDNIKK